jgi:hypothetical protein
MPVKASTLLKQIAKQPSIEALQAFLTSRRDTVKVRRSLLDELAKVIEYDDANEWAAAVRICEALAIVGWGDRERVDAISRFNGDCWETCFVNGADEFRFRQAGWSKRKAGWVLYNPEYYASPDFPEIPAKSWEEFAHRDYPAVQCPKLASQRNCQKQMPFVMGLCGGSSPVSRCVETLKNELTAELMRAMRPAEYGDALDRFYLDLYCPYPGAKSSAGLKIGAWNSKQRAFYCDLLFDDDFASLTRARQQAYFIDNLTRAIDALESKFKRRRIEYDIERFRAHVSSAVKAWQRSGARKKRRGASSSRPD